VLLDPAQVAGDAGKDGRVLLLAASRGSEGGETDLDLVGGQNQRATGVAVAGGHAGGSGHADVRVANGGVVGALALAVGDDLHVGILQVGGHGAGGVGGAAPAGGDDLIVVVGGVAGLLLGQLNVVDGAAVVHVRDADQGDVVPQGAAVPVGVDDDLVLGHEVLNLGAGANGAAQVNLDGVNAVSAVGGGQNPLVSDEGATAPGRGGSDLQGESHLVGELVGAGILAVGDATTGSVQGAQGRSGGVGQSQSEDNENFHVGATYGKYVPLGLIPPLL